MKATSATQVTLAVTLLKSGLSYYQISSRAGLSPSTLSRIHNKHCPEVPKGAGGCPKKLSENDIRYATRLISTGQAENAVQVTRTLREVTNKTFSAQTVRNHMKTAGMKAVVKKKRPLLSKRHIRERWDYAIAHQHWTVEDWKRVVWSDETKINRLGSDGRKWIWKKSGQGLIDREMQKTLKFGGGSLMM
jgi:Transposase